MTVSINTVNISESLGGTLVFMYYCFVLIMFSRKILSSFFGNKFK